MIDDKWKNKHNKKALQELGNKALLLPSKGTKEELFKIADKKLEVLVPELFNILSAVRHNFGHPWQEIHYKSDDETMTIRIELEEGAQ